MRLHWTPQFCLLEKKIKQKKIKNHIKVIKCNDMGTQRKHDNA